jgi:hypothetical protein
MKYIILLFSLFVLTSNVYSQEATEGVSVEQNALVYFLENLEGTPINYVDFQGFNFDSATVYVRTSTSFKPSLTIPNPRYSSKSDFFPLDSANQPRVSVKADSIVYKLNLDGLNAINAEGVNFEKERMPLDLLLVFTSSYWYNNHYFVRVFINVKTEWKSTEAIIKLDSTGKPLDMVFSYGVY